jgi:hypothetical protein
VLLDLILCLAHRLDAYCTDTLRLVYEMGDAQNAPVGTALPDVLAVRVVDGDGAMVADEPVTFRVRGGGGSVGRVEPLGATYSENSDPNTGIASTGWKLGSTAGLGVVEASIASGATVTFTSLAFGRPATSEPPYVMRSWPPTGAQLTGHGPALAFDWLRQWQEQPRIELTFDRPMDPGQLADFNPWLGVLRLRQETPNTIFAQREKLTYLALDHLALRAPQLGPEGSTATYLIETTQPPSGSFRYIVLIRAERAAKQLIVAADLPHLLLDAEFDGTKLDQAQRDLLWDLAIGDQSVATGVWGGAVGSGATLPRSGDPQRTEGGQFHSCFEVFPA